MIAPAPTVKRKKLFCHLFNYFKADKPIEIRIGSDDPDQWRVCLLIRGELRGAVSQNDCTQLAAQLRKYFTDALQEKEQEKIYAEQQAN